MVLVLHDVTELEAIRDQLRNRRGIHGIIGRHRTMQEIYELVEQLADSDATVLVLGESGTGKELVASAIHHSSHRRAGSFAKVNCAALSESLLESELFGHVKGAFTGALRDKVGRFELAQAGTIFLDEIGDVSLAVQVKLLRVLQERQIERVGSSEPVDCRVIAATNQGLIRSIAEERFRSDLFYRLNVMPIEVPPLRQRREDVPLLVDYFVELFRARTGRKIHDVDDAALQLLTDYPWPGNVRELENAIEHAFIRCRGEVILARCLPPHLQPLASPTKGRLSFERLRRVSGIATKRHDNWGCTARPYGEKCGSSACSHLSQRGTKEIEMRIRNWRDQVPYIGHETKIIWPLLTRKRDDGEDPPDSAVLLSLGSLTRHMVQGRITTDYHAHENKEQVYYFVSGRGKMLIDDKEFDVTAGDAVHLAPKERHQVINNTEDDLEYLNITALMPDSA